mmetsp:Transcript_22033/g.45431  ORF Transcript_22033/g.45431 Transcript_22033/m.45431 type:complete len:84 (-) Transcript_22033:28-279(-)
MDSFLVSYKKFHVRNEETFFARASLKRTGTASYPTNYNCTALSDTVSRSRSSPHHKIERLLGPSDCVHTSWQRKKHQIMNNNG